MCRWVRGLVGAWVGDTSLYVNRETLVLSNWYNSQGTNVPSVTPLPSMIEASNHRLMESQIQKVIW